MTESDSLRRWLDPNVEISLEEGASFAVGNVVTGRVRTIEPNRLLLLDWDTGGDTSVVRFELAVDGTGTVLVLDHELIDEPLGMAYMQLWTNALNRFQP